MPGRIPIRTMLIGTQLVIPMSKTLPMEEIRTTPIWDILLSQTGAGIREAVTMSRIPLELGQKREKDIMAPISLLRNLPESIRKRKKPWERENAS